VPCSQWRSWSSLLPSYLTLLYPNAVWPHWLKSSWRKLLCGLGPFFIRHWMRYCSVFVLVDSQRQNYLQISGISLASSVIPSISAAVNVAHPPQSSSPQLSLPQLKPVLWRFIQRNNIFYATNLAEGHIAPNHILQACVNKPITIEMAQQLWHTIFVERVYGRHNVNGDPITTVTTTITATTSTTPLQRLLNRKSTKHFRGRAWPLLFDMLQRIQAIRTFFHQWLSLCHEPIKFTPTAFPLPSSLRDTPQSFWIHQSQQLRKEYLQHVMRHHSLPSPVVVDFVMKWLSSMLPPSLLLGLDDSNDEEQDHHHNTTWDENHPNAIHLKQLVTWFVTLPCRSHLARNRLLPGLKLQAMLWLACVTITVSMMMSVKIIHNSLHCRYVNNAPKHS